MRITILGATGNMGRRVIAEALSRGHDVMGVAHNREGLSTLPSSVDAQIGDANNSGGFGDPYPLTLSVRFGGVSGVLEGAAFA